MLQWVALDEFAGKSKRTDTGLVDAEELTQTSLFAWNTCNSRLRLLWWVILIIRCLI